MYYGTFAYLCNVKPILKTMLKMLDCEWYIRQFSLNVFHFNKYKILMKMENSKNTKNI